ncbi:hypothetical protein LAZ67_1007727 [Cordylochernes scorpioides]|uniref:Uncharacterized protein n=1 Tax=Cordylochernes scorpioides TaxID=51811 RepID=A0ABY6K326_9ARAC|nr:hypothetical protein LAZ67_1007727 [Cordylochernes scorpioides]
METSKALHWTRQQQQFTDWTSLLEEGVVCQRPRHMCLSCRDAICTRQVTMVATTPLLLHSFKIQKCMETSKTLHWTRQQQQLIIDLDPEQQLYTPKIVNIATVVIEMYGDI